MHWLDYVIIIITALSMITGLFRGFVKETLALIIWILAIFCAYKYCSSFAPLLQHYISEKNTRIVVSFLIILFAVILSGGILNASLGYLLTLSGLGGTDRVLGMGFGFIRGVFISALLIMGINMTSVSPEFRQESKLYPTIKPVVIWISSYLPGIIEKIKHYDHSKDEHSKEQKEVSN